MNRVRDHISDRFSVNRIGVELRRGARPAKTVVIGLVAAAAAALYIASNISPLLLHRDRTISFAVRDATGIVPGRQELRVRGIKAGTISGVRPDGDGAIVTARIKDEFGPIYQDARAAVRPTTALQDMYLDILDRGTPSAGEIDAGNPLPASRTSTAVNLTEVLNLFDVDTRTHLRTLLANLGNGLGGRGQALRSAFVQLTPLLRSAGDVAQQLNERHDLTQRLIHNATLVTEELGARDATLRRLIAAGARVATGVQSRAADLDQALRQLPPTLTTADSTFTAVSATLGDLDTAVRRLGPVARELPSALTALEGLGADADPAIAALQPVVRQLRPLARALSPVARNLEGGTAQLRPQVPVLDRVTQRLAGCTVPLQNFFQWNASLTKFSDDGGGLPRGNVLLNFTAPGATSDPNILYPAGCTPGPVLGGRPVRPEDQH